MSYELISRPANEEDLEVVKHIANSNLKSFNPREKSIGDLEAGEFIKGFFEPAITRLTRSPNSEDWESFITLNPDVSRKRFYLDIYTLPGAKTLELSLELALKLAKEFDPSFQLWLGVQSNDSIYKSLLESRAFALIRKYWTLEMDLDQKPNLKINCPGQIREIDVHNPAELRSFHSVHQDSFSKHFGFMPRSFEDWSRFVLQDADELGLRVWLISLNGEDVGFLDCNDELKHEECGYVAGLGVRLAHHGKGLGEALLRHAIQIHTALGRKKLCLNVDAGNESGALRLYDKVGMKPFSEWHQYENPNWSDQEFGS
jgi:GNAT superfamily N-acetyltransferase